MSIIKYKEYLERLNEVVKDKEVVLIPHKNPDVDAIISCVLLSKLLDFLNILNSIRIYDEKISKDTSNLLSSIGINPDKYKKDESEAKNSDNLILLDHYETNLKGKVLAIIDHHYTNKKIKAKTHIYEPTCSASYIVYKLIEEASMQITKEIANLVVYASMVDTSCFKSTKSIKSEEDEIMKLISDFSLDGDEIINKSLMLTNLSEMTVEEIAANGCKEYNFNQNKVFSSYIQVKNQEAEYFVPDILIYILNRMQDLEIKLWVFIIFDFEREDTQIYYVKGQKIESELKKGILSRGKDIIPKIEEEFNKKGN